MDAPKLKLCPYCDGTKAEIVHETSLAPPFYYAKCPSCGSGPPATTEAEAARLWNERPQAKQAEWIYLQMKTILHLKSRVEKQRIAELEAELEKERSRKIFAWVKPEISRRKKAA